MKVQKCLYSKKIFLLIIVFFAYLGDVYAAQITGGNFCEDVSNVFSVGGGNTCNGGTKSVTIKTGIATTTVNTEKKTNVPYDVVFLIDDSGSMTTKQDKANNMINYVNSITSKIKSISSSSKFKYCYFNKINGQYCFSDFNSTTYTNNLKSNNQTNIQNALSNAMQYLKSNTCTSTIPLVVLITDGYPNMFRVDNIQYKIPYSDFSKILYYTLTSLKDLRNNLCSESKIITIGIDMDSNDAMAKYFLNPTAENYNNLNASSYTEAKNLYSILSTAQGGTYQYVEAVSGTTDFGLYRGEVRTNSSQRLVVRFDLTGMTNSSRNLWENNNSENYFKLRFYIPINSGTCNSNNSNCNNFINYLYRIIIYDKNDSSKQLLNITKNFSDYISKGNCVNSIVGTCTHMQFILKYSSTVKNIGKIEFVFKKKSDSSSNYLTENNITKTTLNGIQNYTQFATNVPIVNASFVGSMSEVSTWIENSLNFSNDLTTSVTSEYKATSYSPCINSSSSKIFYISTPNTTLYTISQGVVNKNSGKTCNQVTVTIPTIITESASFSVGNFSSPIYAGGGFSWSGGTVTNTTSWYYRYLSNEYPMFNLSFNNLYDINGIKYKDEGLKVLSETPLYKDASCTTLVTNEDLKSSVNVSVENLNTSGLYKSVNNNDANKGDSNVNVLSNMSRKNDVTSGAGGSFTQSYTISLPTAYINKTTAEVTYSDKSSDTSYNSAGNLYYVPLNAGTSVNFYTEGNISSIKGITINAKSTCTVAVKHILYDPPDKEGENFKAAYSYRSITVNNPFPTADTSDKTTYPENWRDWYCGSGNSCSTSNSNKVRIANSYSNYPSNPLYKIVFDSDKKYFISNQTSNYASFDNIKNDGHSSFVETVFENGGNPSISNSYCGLGIWSKSCDAY